MRKLWLITTEHLKAGLWFRDEEDYKVGMNFVAIQAHASRVVVLSFTLMSNHVHFVVKAESKKDAEAFIEGFKHRYSLYLRRKYGVKEFLRGNGVQIDFISPYDEAPEKAIAYVEMNCVAANICSHPSQYPWGTGCLFFDQRKPDGRPLGSFSKRACKRLLHTDVESLPDNWLIGADGYILPQNYVDVEAVQAFFRTPQRMNWFLTNSSKAKKRLEADYNLPAFRDQVILAAVPDLCQSLFGKRKFSQLTRDEQVEFVRQLHFRFSAHVNQIARVCGLTYEQAARLMDSV
ncbi:MAG: transposase [Bacteroidales bacterium]|nr:transposase [Bacteroidales bacterium]